MLSKTRVHLYSDHNSGWSFVQRCWQNFDGGTLQASFRKLDREKSEKGFSEKGSENEDASA